MNWGNYFSCHKISGKAVMTNVPNSQDSFSVLCLILSSDFSLSDWLLHKAVIRCQSSWLTSYLAIKEGHVLPQQIGRGRNRGKLWLTCLGHVCIPDQNTGQGWRTLIGPAWVHASLESLPRTTPPEGGKERFLKRREGISPEDRDKAGLNPSGFLSKFFSFPGNHSFKE